jgi:ribonuclease R
VHRLIRNYSQNATENVQEYWAARIPEIAQETSRAERRAVDAEREVEKIKKAEYMAQFVGEELDGVISSVTSFGAFVELDNTVEGLIHISTLKNDYLQFNARALTLTGERTGLTFKIGQPVHIKVVRADKATGDVDFEWLPSDFDHFEKPIKPNKNKKKKTPAAAGRSSHQPTDKHSQKQAFYTKAAKGKFSSSRSGKGDGVRGKKRGR